MTRAVPPLPPPRPRQDSVSELLGHVLSLGTRLDRLETTTAKLEAGTRSETVKVIVAGVVSVVTAVTGAHVLAPTPPATTTVVQRSAFDRALDACRELPEQAERAECIARVLAQSTGTAGPPR